MPTVEVRFKDVTLETNAVVGTSALPSLINWTKEIVEMVGFVSKLMNDRMSYLSCLVFWYQPGFL